VVRPAVAAAFRPPGVPRAHARRRGFADRARTSRRTMDRPTPILPAC